MNAVAVILAAGQGTRMKSDLPKVLHEIDGRPMVSYVVDAVRAAGVERAIVVIGYEAELVRAACSGDAVEFVVQSEQLGTGHAVLQAEPLLDGFDGTVVVLNGDVPGLRSRTLRRLLDHHHGEGASATVLTARLADAGAYGRIVRAADGSLTSIIEFKDASGTERDIREINSGLFCFQAVDLFSALHAIGRGNAQNEYYLTDVVGILSRAGARVSAFCVDESREVAGINTVDELDEVRRFIAGGS